MSLVANEYVEHTGEYAARTQRLIWTRSRLGTLGVPRVTLSVKGPDADSKFWACALFKGC